MQDIATLTLKEVVLLPPGESDGASRMTEWLTAPQEGPGPTFHLLAQPTPLQVNALDLLGVDFAKPVSM